MEPRVEVAHLLTLFEGHASQEQEFIREYEQVAQKIQNPEIKFLVDLIVRDEEKHHELIGAMATTIRGAVAGSELAGTLPRIDSRQDQARLNELVALTERFIQAEKRGIRNDRKLLEGSRRLSGGLFSLLLETMILDSKKHVLILKFIRSRLTKSAGSRGSWRSFRARLRP